MAAVRQYLRISVIVLKLKNSSAVRYVSAFSLLCDFCVTNSEENKTQNSPQAIQRLYTFLEECKKRHTQWQTLYQKPSMGEEKGIPRENCSLPRPEIFPEKRIISGRKHPSPVSKICVKELVVWLTSCRI